MSDSHTFALYTSALQRDITQWTDGQSREITLTDGDLAQRISHVLRLRPGEQIIIFDGICVATLTIIAMVNRPVSVTVAVQKLEIIKEPSTRVILCPALLKTDAWEMVLYAAAQMGASEIVPIVSEKVHSSAKMLRHDRAQRIMIAACEQAKQFVLPQLREAQSLDTVVARGVSRQQEQSANAATLSVYCDPSGVSLIDFLGEIHQKNSLTLQLFVGPEGGFTARECAELDQAGVRKVALTSSILRASDAVIVALGAIQSVIGERSV